ncbi:Beta-catenin-like protein 1 [Vitis vinifera]|uniref:Beta-catenin-like protein 1 n=1 Tax=Vitis vinifera TaxID=29760 RepID=A0A438FLZ0_VITVI|nr:Beta-catenin-like protein 1 [Vitis vinifera]
MSIGTQFSDSSNETNVYPPHVMSYGQPSSSTDEEYGMSHYSPSRQMPYQIPYQMEEGFGVNTWVNFEYPIHVEAQAGVPSSINPIEPHRNSFWVYNVLLQAMELANARSALKRKRDDAIEPFDNGTAATATTDASSVDLSLLEAVEKSQTTVEVLDLKTLKRLVLAFERRLRDNIEARLKYPDQPDKFADSEIELHEEIQRLKTLAGGPELYPDLVNLNVIPSILGLLSHDNSDIAVDVVGLLQDLTDEDVLEDNDEPARVLVDALIENNVLELLVQNLTRLSEFDPDEMAAVYATLATLENLIEVKPAVAEMVCERTKLMRWLLGKIKVREFDSNKQYASEILAILLQNSAANQRRLGQMNGVDVVLQAVAMYKSRDPKTADEEEMVENLFDCLCCLLMPLENKERFVRAEGVELMIIIMKQKKLAYGSAIRALDFAMTKYPPACERFVDVLGLKTAFAAFMGKASAQSPFHFSMICV